MSATPNAIVVWASWPQACFTRHEGLVGHINRFVDGQGIHVRRSATTGPGLVPLSKATTPCLATLVFTSSKPRERNFSATIAKSVPRDWTTPGADENRASTR